GPREWRRRWLAPAGPPEWGRARRNRSAPLNALCDGLIPGGALLRVAAQSQFHGQVDGTFQAYILQHRDEGCVRGGRQRLLQCHGGLIGSDVFDAVLARRAAGGTAVAEAIDLHSGRDVERGLQPHALLDGGSGGEDLEY